MDHENIPPCAMVSGVGTVILRVRMERTRQGRQAGRPARAEHSGCERCNRTRTISQHDSDCDSVVEKCRPYSATTARSRYVNVCAAVCLLVLVGGLSPQCSAAPPRARTMDRQRRAIDTNSHLWDNPCDYADSNAKPTESVNIKQLADNLAKQANSALKGASQYKDEFANTIHNYKTFEALLPFWENEEWLRKFPWYRPEVLPQEKVLDAPLPEQYMNELMTKMDDVMPAMYKALKVIVASLYTFSSVGLKDDFISYETLRPKINNTAHNVRAVLCMFSDIVRARNLEILPLEDSEIPDFTTVDKTTTNGLFLYRDTLNYLEYLAQVFKKYHEMSA